MDQKKSLQSLATWCSQKEAMVKAKKSLYEFFPGIPITLTESEKFGELDEQELTEVLSNKILLDKWLESVYTAKILRGVKNEY